MSSSSDSTESSPPPPSSDSSPPPPSDSSPPPPSDSSPPPPSDSSPPPPSDSSPPPPSESSPPPPSGSSPPPPPSSPPPPSKKSSPPPPPSNDDNDDDGSPPSPPPPPPPPSPPPPPQKGRNSPSSHSRSLAPPESDSSSGDEKAMITGVAAGAGLLFLIMIVFLVSCGRRKKRKHHDHMNYYRDNSRGDKGTDYYIDTTTSNDPWNKGMAGMKVPMQPGSTNVSSEHNWLVPPPPPPPMMSSSEMSSAGFSGPHHAPLPPPHPAVALGFNQSSFTYNDLAVATKNFAQSNLLGQGGFGYVHKGVLPNGKDIAVKSLKLNSGQGDREFQAEVDIISRVHHRHLVSLVGHCSAGTQRMLVYEFVPNGTLEYHLHGTGTAMDWPTRLKIALGSAKGFAYLHEDCHPRIIHRDIKAANILIDFNFEAKVADFGLAKLSSDTNTHVSTRIMGTFGYLAPEYASSGKLSEKSDVYSYGIMLLELITGRRPVDIRRDDDDDTLVDWARPILMSVTEGGSYEGLVDPRLGDNYDPQEMLRMVYSAAACIRHSARRRPKMSQIVRALEGDVSLDDLNDGIKSSQSALLGSRSSSECDLQRFNKRPGTPSSQDFNSSEMGATGELVHSSAENSHEMQRHGGGYHTRTP